MKSFFAKLTLSALLIAGVAFTPKKSEAAAVLMSSPVGVVMVLGHVSAVAGGIAVFPFMMGGGGDPLFNALALAGVGLFVLDESQKEGVDVDSLANFLAIRYPQINDNVFFDELSKLIASKFKLDEFSSSKNAPIKYNFSDSELNPVLALLDRTGIEKEIGRLVNDLK
jgi:hypothetical protein